MFKIALHILLFSVMSTVSFSQELNCSVEILSQKLQRTEAQVFKTLEQSIYEFMNNRRWTDDIYKIEERIECSLFINITEELGSGIYRATASIQSSRPIFNSSYNSVLLNYSDRDWVFQYTEYLPLEYQETGYLSNLTSMLAYYAYLIIAMDYDTYSLNGGAPYYLKAQNVVNNVPSNLSSEIAPGWKPFDSNRNRYWVVENALNPKFLPEREAFYLYHLKGMDIMYDDVKAGRQSIMTCLRKVASVAEDSPNGMLVKLFFDAKSDELISIFKAAAPSEKAAAVQLLYKSDPGRSSDYAKIMK